MKKQTQKTISFYLFFLLAIANFIDAYQRSRLTWMSYTPVILFAIVALIRALTRGNRNG